MTLGICRKTITGRIQRAVITNTCQHILQPAARGVVIERIEPGNHRRARPTCQCCQLVKMRAIIGAISWREQHIDMPAGGCAGLNKAHQLFTKPVICRNQCRSWWHHNPALGAIFCQRFNVVHL